MLKIDATVRNAIRTVLTASEQYDAASMRIARNGSVTALKSADKTLVSDNRRYLVGYASDMVRKAPQNWRQAPADF